ncbi:hypothetical protein CWS43_26100 [Rahnella sp. AA]|uniref:hypothetical protein n=1 Tax=Rahnella sp. AA TaxID=2057180 RepID=UPI000C33EA0F|nr:hypothetical protein [Rahnella sp. AA]PKE27599.1 hypothetical protein CWS43_26100 [Rahnella sp. AA]
MQYSALKTGAGACWTTFRLLVDILVIGPVFIFSLFLFFSAWPSPGTFLVSQAEMLVRGTAPEKVWDCPPLPEALSVNPRAIPQPVKPQSPYLCLPEQVSRDTYIAGFNHSLLTFYGLVTLIYATFYVTAGIAFRGWWRPPVATRGITVRAENKEPNHE